MSKQRSREGGQFAQCHTTATGLSWGSPSHETLPSATAHTEETHSAVASTERRRQPVPDLESKDLSMHLHHLLVAKPSLSLEIFTYEVKRKILAPVTPKEWPRINEQSAPTNHRVPPSNVTAGPAPSCQHRKAGRGAPNQRSLLPGTQLRSPPPRHLSSYKSDACPPCRLQGKEESSNLCPNPCCGLNGLCPPKGLCI